MMTALRFVAGVTSFTIYDFEVLFAYTMCPFFRNSYFIFADKRAGCLHFSVLKPCLLIVALMK